MEEKKNYYAIIPANVRYDNDLTPNAKLLYGEITALCNQEGYCWATNEYFSKLYKVSKVTVSRWIKELKEKGYINVDIIYKNGSKEIDYRYIQICIEGINKNDNTPINKIVKDNNTNINNTTNNTKENINKRKNFIKPTLEEIDKYCQERKNKIDPQHFIDYYEANGWMVGRNKMKDWKACVRTWEARQKKDKPKNEPEWFDKEIEIKEPSAEEKAELESILRKFSE